MDFIQIIDDFLNKDEISLLLRQLNTEEYQYGHKSGGGDKLTICFFSTSKEIELKTLIFNKIQNYVSKKLKVDRFYVHTQNFGQDGKYHVDTELPHTYSFCLYVNDVPDSMENTYGDFLFKIPNDNKIICVESKLNRGVFFPSTYLHKGLPYNRFYHNRRMCVTFKFTEIV